MLVSVPYLFVFVTGLFHPVDWNRRPSVSYTRVPLTNGLSSIKNLHLNGYIFVTVACYEVRVFVWDVNSKLLDTRTTTLRIIRIETQTRNIHFNIPVTSYTNQVYVGRLENKKQKDPTQNRWWWVGGRDGSKVEEWETGSGDHPPFSSCKVTVRGRDHPRNHVRFSPHSNPQLGY